MAQFYGSMQGGRGQVTRTGTKGSGMQAHVRGWHVGARVELSHENGKDTVRIWRTEGSAASGFADALIAEYTLDDAFGSEHLALSA